MFDEYDLMQRSAQIISSVARGELSPPPPIDMFTKMQNEKNATFLALLGLFYVLERTK